MAAVAALLRGGRATQGVSSQWRSLSESETECAEAFKQCGGEGYTGVTCCQSGCICAETDNEYFMQCEPADVNGSKCDPSRVRYAQEAWMHESKTTKKDAQRAERSVKGLKVEKKELTELVAKLKEEVKQADRDLEERKKLVHDAVLAHADPPQEEGCGKESGNCGTEGNPDCCQSGCTCEGDQYYGQCKTSDGSDTCLESITNALAEDISTKRAELDESQQTHDETHSSLEAKTAELKKVTKSLAKAQEELKTKMALATGAAKKLAGWQSYNKPSGSNKSKTRGNTSIGHQSHNKRSGSNGSKTHGNMRTKKDRHSHKHETHGDERAEKDGKGKTDGDRDDDDAPQQLEPELSNEWDNDDW